ncbi:hypothetical protein RUM44_000303 [Polyplax serrata]|uniref:Mannosyltransferase n=1 Tax=Polyplax serrata TaxID=468196 RepID=A0ABR1B564_POLSC
MDFVQTFQLKSLPGYLYRYCKWTINTLINLKLGCYWFWVSLRIALTLVPQTGYIHPDEFFQTVEVFAGNAFDTEISLPWEFNASFPIRSIPLIYMFVYVPFATLRNLSEIIKIYTDVTILGHYALLVVPRLSMCLLSFTSDVCLFKICYHFCQNYKERLIMFSSSFVCLVFMTRTFTNTLEITCFNVLLCLVASCMAESEKVNYQNDYLKDKYNDAKSIPERVRITKLMKLLPKHSLKKCVPIAVATVSGFFNRPTFVLYAVTPLFYWFQRGLTVRSTFLKDFHVRLLIFVIYCIPVVCFYIYFDSAYYGYITWGEILNMKISSDNFVVTPLNFIKYNLDSSNLSKHGLHPRFLHFLVNIPLLFNILGISGLIVIAKLFYRSGLSNWTLLPKSQSITGMMTLSFVVPVLGLSIFPHQEPRFITPILLPLVFLYSHVVGGFEEHHKTIVPFRKRYPKPKQSTGIFKYPLKCIEYFERVTEDIDNRYNINGRYLTNVMGYEIVESSNAARPHEEPRTDEDDDEEFKEETIERKDEDGEAKSKEKKSRTLMKLWYLCNGFCVLFFGFLHQGGIYDLSRDFHQKLLVKPRYTTYHLVTSHIYSLPLHLLAIKKNYKYKNTNFVAHEMGSENFEKINLRLLTVLRFAESRKKSMKRNYKVFYALPTTLYYDFRYHHRYYSNDYNYHTLEIFYPHFSTEAPPNIRLNVTDKSDFRYSEMSNGIFSVCDCFSVRYLMEFFQQFGLLLMEVTLPGD